MRLSDRGEPPPAVVPAAAAGWSVDAVCTWLVARGFGDEATVAARTTGLDGRTMNAVKAALADGGQPR